jgi:hypothetical protein
MKSFLLLAITDLGRYDFDNATAGGKGHDRTKSSHDGSSSSEHCRDSACAGLERFGGQRHARADHHRAKSPWWDWRIGNWRIGQRDHSRADPDGAEQEPDRRQYDIGFGQQQRQRQWKLGVQWG